ncbi:hypothetical protein GH714_027584 [Hevea brasiliensis]|uniref:Uncharacterized protein n=1 Tax=Hevea brasiliensis TaxID=3981 RepID=A0A6A6NJF9_HEVBR|nr:hypothetical protein GH714_027482 [Hevea brasiliensis]KAF2325409.1 hypothetical protein GH714_027584 [Hevea brasiliensis]
MDSSWEASVVALDVVDDVSQLSVLAGYSDWFSEGSRIIIAPRNKEVLIENLEDESYERAMKEWEDALKSCKKLDNLVDPGITLKS